MVDYALAFALGIAFQYFSIKVMRGLSVGRNINETLRVDTSLLTSFQVGLYGWTAVMQFVLFPKGIDSNHVVFWFLKSPSRCTGFNVPPMKLSAARFYETTALAKPRRLSFR